MSVPVTDGLVLWLDAGEASKMTLSGDTVTEWRDKMGSSTKATTRAGAPTLVADGINGLPTVHFDTLSWMNDGVDRSAGPVTILYVSRETGGTNSRVLSATGNNWLLGYNGVRNRFYFEGWVYQGSVDADTDPHLYAATIGGAGKNSTVYAEGVLLASNQNGTQGPKILQLNGFMGATELSDCDISEVLVFNRVLSKDELNDVGYYLQQKYDLQGAYRGPEPVLDFDKSQVLLPTRKPGAPEITTSFTLTNIGATGTQPLEISAINTGSLAPFVIKSVVKNMTQALSAPYATSLDKAAGDQLVVTVALSPMTDGTFQGNFTVQSNDSANPSQRFDVTGCVAESGSPVTDGLVFHLDAAKGVIKDASNNVSDWLDLSGSGFGATTRAGAPTLVADGINGLPTVHFDTSSWMNDEVDRSAGPVTILYVSRETGGTNLRVLNATNNNWMLGYDGVRDRFYFEGWVYQGSVAADTDPHLYAATIGGAGKNSTVYAEGVLLASNQNGTQGPNKLQLNGYAAGNQQSDCDISEVLVFNRVLPKDELNDVGYYLQQKYDLQGAYRGPEPVLNFDKSQVLLPTRKPGAPEITTSFILTNIGSNGTPPLEISAINTGSLAPFVIKSVVKNMTQTLSAPYATSLDKAAGDQLVVTVALSPMTDGIFQGNFTVQSNDSANPSQRFDVTGCVAESGSPVTDGLVFHLDAAKGVLKDTSDNVSDWLDLSGNGVGATTRAGAPTLVADGINGLPTVHFDTSSWMNDGVDRSAGPVTILYVSRETGGTNLRVLNATNNNWLLGYNGVRNRFYFEGWVYQGSVDADTDPHLYAATIGGAGKNSTVYAEGVLLASNQSGTQGPNKLQLNGYMGATELSDCDISEVLMFNRVLANGELNDVGYYLQQKYDLQGDYTAPAAKFSVTPTVIDYGYVEPAAGKVTREIVVKNDGSPSKILNLSFTASLGAAYKIESVVRSSDPQPVSANNYQTTLGMNDTLTIQVSFDPTKTAPTGTEGLKFTHNGNVAGTNEMVDLFLFGRPGNPGMPPVTDGLYLFAAVDNITMCRDGWPVWNWTDYSGNGNDAVLKAGSPTYIANGINGKPVIRFNGTDEAYYSFTTCEDARTVFVVLKEDADASGDQIMAPIIANRVDTTPDFCRGENKAIFNTNTNGDPFAGDYVHPQVKTAEVRVNGAVVNALSTPVPNNMSILSVAVKNPEWGVWLDQIGRDRNNTTRAWKGDYAEVIIYNRELTAKEIQHMGVYLQTKYGITGTFAETPGPEMAVSTTSVDFGRVPKGVRPFTQTVSVLNRGFGSPELEISSIGVTGSTNFNVESVTVEGVDVTTADFSASLAGDSAERMEITVSFASDTADSFTGNLVIKSNDPVNPTLTVPLKAVVPAVWFDLSGAWDNKDIGEVGAAGSTTFTPDKNNPTNFTVSGSGADIYGTSDELQYAYKQVAGDAEMVARVDSHLFGSNKSWSKAGVMIRETLDGNSKHVFMFACPAVVDGGLNSSLYLQGRTATGGESYNTTTPVAFTTHPVWVKLRRVGNLFYASGSVDGSTWQALSPNPVYTAMNPTVYFGLAVDVGADGEMATAEFSNVAITSLESGEPIPTAYVKPEATGTGDGSSWANATNDLKKALGRVKVSGGGEVWMTAGTYNLTETVALPAHVAVLGGFTGTETEAWQRDPRTNLTIVNQTGTNQRVFEMGSSLGFGAPGASLDGLVISGGNKTGTGEHSDAGGAMYVRYPDASNAIRNCVFVNNSTKSWGGALAVFDGYKTFVVENCYFAGNQSGDNGGAVFSAWSGATFLNCVFAGNMSAVDGAALGGNYHYTAADREVDFVNCTFADNRALNKGIIYTFQNEMGPVKFTNSIVANNDFGGPLFFEGGATVMRDTCLFFGNTTTTLAGEVTGGADVLGDPKFVGGATGAWATVAPVAGTSTTVLTATAEVFGAANSLVGKTINPNTTGTPQSLQSLIIANTANSVTIIGNGLGAVAGTTFQVFDYALQTGSAAIDAGVQTVAATDIRGVVRPDGTAFDIGAYEFAAAVPDYYGLTVNEVGLGTVGVLPQAETYVAGSVVMLTAHPDAGQRLKAWTGVPAGQEKDNPLMLTMDGDKVITATFEVIPLQYTLTLEGNPAEAVESLTKDPQKATYEAGDVVTLTATPKSGYKFDGWFDGATAVSSPYTMPASNKTLTAKFSVSDKIFVTVAADPDQGGTVSRNPDKPEGYVLNDVVTLTAAEKDGYTFTGWYDGDTPVSSEKVYVYTVATNANKTFKAKFAPVVTYALTAKADPTTAGEVTKVPDQATYLEGAKVTLTAPATPTGYTFTGWFDGETPLSTDNPYEYTMPASKKDLVAKFTVVVPGQYALTLDDFPDGAAKSLTKDPQKATYAAGDVVTLTATANDDYTFVGWFDGDTPVTSPYTMPAAPKALTAKFTAKTKYALTVAPDDAAKGSASKSPDAVSYLEGAKVTLTATPKTGYKFDGWFDGENPLSTDNPYEYTMPAAAKSLKAKFSALGPNPPTNVAAVGNTYMVTVSWSAATDAASYVVTRTSGTLVATWTTSATQFADDTALPGVTYAYTVKSVNAQQVESAPSAAASASVTAETFALANYKVTAKGYTMTRDASNNLTFAGATAGTIKIAALKKMPSNAADNAAKGIYYLTNLGQVPTLTITGDVKTLAFDVPVYSLEASGLVKSVSAKSVTFLKAREFGTVSIAATKDSGAGLYARTFIETAGTGTTPMSIKATGAVIEEVGSTGATAQPVKLLNVASKVYKDANKVSKTSLGAIGSLPKVVADVAGTAAPASEATPSSIQGSVLKAVTVSGGPVVADELVGAIDKVTVAGGNLRAALIQSTKDLVLVQATAKKGVGGAIGTAGAPTALAIKAQPNAKKTAIGKVYGETTLSGYFYAGYNATTGAAAHTGGIGTLQTKTGTVQGAAFLDPTLVSKMKVLPKGQTIPTNPDL